MKKIISLLVMLFGVLFLHAQGMDNASVPIAVKARFAKLYPNIKTTFEWEKEQENYEAHYKENDTAKTAVFSPGGKFIQSENQIRVTGLPKAATDYLAKNLPGKKIREASQITDPNGVVTYEAAIKEINYFFDVNGNFLKQEVDEN